MNMRPIAPIAGWDTCHWRLSDRSATAAHRQWQIDRHRQWQIDTDSIVGKNMKFLQYSASGFPKVGTGVQIGI